MTLHQESWGFLADKINAFGLCLGVYMNCSKPLKHIQETVSSRLDPVSQSQSVLGPNTGLGHFYKGLKTWRVSLLALIQYFSKCLWKISLFQITLLGVWIVHKSCSCLGMVTSLLHIGERNYSISKKKSKKCVCAVLFSLNKRVSNF